MAMSCEEFNLRWKIIEHIRLCYPGAERIDFSEFLGGAKVEIDSWVGDSFAAIWQRHMHAGGEWSWKNYEKYREILFLSRQGG